MNSFFHIVCNGRVLAVCLAVGGGPCLTVLFLSLVEQVFYSSEQVDLSLVAAHTLGTR